MPASESQSTWRPSADVVSRAIRGEVLLVPIRRQSADLEGFFTLNPTAAEIWQLACGGANADAIVAELTRRYAVDRETAARDAGRILAELVEIGALCPAPGAA